MDAVDREVEFIRENILTLKCPRCDTRSDYPGGCLALTCLVPTCGWRFCAHCLECFLPEEGERVHDHVAECEHNPIPGDIFPPGKYNDSPARQIAYFEEVVQTRRFKRLLSAHIKRLPPELHQAVLAKLAPDLQRHNIML